MNDKIKTEQIFDPNDDHALDRPNFYPGMGLSTSGEPTYWVVSCTPRSDGSVNYEQTDVTRDVWLDLLRLYRASIGECLRAEIHNALSGHDETIPALLLRIADGVDRS